MQLGDTQLVVTGLRLPYTHWS